MGWTTDLNEVLSMLRKSKERGTDRHVSSTSIGLRMMNACAPPVAYLLDVVPDPDTGSWNVNAWFSDEPALDPSMRELALTVMAGTEKPHATVSVFEPDEESSLIPWTGGRKENESRFAADNVIHEISLAGYSLKAQYISSFVSDHVPHISFSSSWENRGALVHGTWYGYPFIFTTRRYAAVLKVGNVSGSGLPLWSASIDLSKPVGCKAAPEELPYLNRMAQTGNDGWVTREGFAALFCTTARSLRPVPFHYYFDIDPDWTETIYASTEEQAVAELLGKYPKDLHLPTQPINKDPRVFPLSMPPFMNY